MKTDKFLAATFGLATVITLLFTSCRKDNKNNDDTDISSVSDSNLAEHYSNDIVSIAAECSDEGTTTSYRIGNNEQTLSGSATVATDSINKIITVTFNGGVCIDGRTRSGTLTINYSSSTLGARHYRDPGFSCSVASTNYVVDGNKVNIINKSISNTTPTGFDPAVTNLTWNISADIHIVKSGNGGTFTWTCDHTETLLNTSTLYHGSSSPIPWTIARIAIGGSSLGITTTGESFSATISTALIRDFGQCNIGGKHPFIQGTMDFIPSSKSTRHIDFGNGACDNTATVTINSQTYTVSL